MAHLSLGVLGSLQVLVDDTPITTLESDKARALLVYLAVEADRPHRRETLVGLLWPDSPEHVARHNLRQALFNLRLALGDHTASPSYFLISRDAIQFNRESDFSLDLAQFNQIFYAHENNLNRVSADSTMIAAQLEEMVKLYRGEFLQQFYLEDSAEFEEWALMQRDNLHQRVLDAFHYLAAFYELQGDYQAVRRHATRQLELEPWREEAHSQMMRALALDGQRSAALAQYETCRRILAEELGVEPSEKTLELYDQIRTGKLKTKDEPTYTPAVPIHKLPVSLTPFLGREQELSELDRLIANPECRCVTLVGPGGIGKTRLALQTAGRQRNAFIHGVVFVPLASAGSVEQVISDIANGISFSFYGASKPKQQLLNYLRERHMLFVLDNVEQLLVAGTGQENTVEFVIEVLQQAPGVKLLVTSREALNLQEEWVFEVRGLPFPEKEQTEEFTEYAAVELFIQRARRASPGFIMNDTDRAGVTRICRLVEGMPLAIELAATWVRMLSPGEIAKEIESSLDFLSASLRDLPERHRSMRMVFDHSWQRLSVKEQRVLAQLSAFQGGFHRQAAEKVAGASLSILSTLVNRTLLRRTAASRYDLHELVRQYSAAHLAADPEMQAEAQQRHYAFYLDLVETASQEIKGRNQFEWLSRLEQERDNLGIAFEYALKTDSLAQDGDELALRLSGKLHWFWWMHGHFHEGQEWLTKALRLHPQRRTAARASALLGISLIFSALGDLGAARPPVEESAAIYRELGDQQGLAEALTIAGRIWVWHGESTLGRAQLEEALGIFRKIGDRWGEAQALCRLGHSLVDYNGDLSGRAMLEESAAIMEDLGEKYLLDSFLNMLGIDDMGLGDYAAARAHLEHALAVAREIEHPWGVADALINLGCVYRIQGEYATAQSHFEEAFRVYREHGISVWEIDVLCALAENAITQGFLSTAKSHLQAASNLLGTSENKWLQTLLRYFQGLLAYYAGDARAAAVLLSEAALLAREGQYKPDLARSLVSLGRARCALGEITLASESLLEGLAQFRTLGHKLGMAAALEGLGALSKLQGDGAQAVMLFSVADALREAIGAPRPPIDCAAYDSAVAASRAQLGETAFAEASARAAARQYQEVVEELLQNSQQELKTNSP